MCNLFKISGLLSQMMREKRWKSHLALIQMRSSKKASLLLSFLGSTQLRQKLQGITSLTPRALRIAEALTKTKRTSTTFWPFYPAMTRLMPWLYFSSQTVRGWQFCVLELLTHLHKSLVTNIIFAFTNSRGTFYRPGDTLPVLKQLLKEKKIDITLSPKTYFCFDNEAFRYYLISVKWL